MIEKSVVFFWIQKGIIMGTRNITRVISDGEVKINQYCQWDGYPTGRGADVLRNIQHMMKFGLLDMMREKLRSSNLLNLRETNKNAVTTYTGAPYTEESKRIFEKVDEALQNASYIPLMTRLHALIADGEISLEEAKYHIVASRDSGNDVLRFMMDFRPDGMTFYTDPYLSGMPPEGDWQIEAMYILDLDRETAEIWWHGDCQKYSFSEISQLTDDQLNEAMKHLEAFEQVVDEKELNDILN